MTLAALALYLMAPIVALAALGGLAGRCTGIRPRWREMRTLILIAIPVALVGIVAYAALANHYFSVPKPALVQFLLGNGGVVLANVSAVLYFALGPAVLRAAHGER